MKIEVLARKNDGEQRGVRIHERNKKGGKRHLKNIAAAPRIYEASLNRRCVGVVGALRRVSLAAQESLGKKGNHQTSSTRPSSARQ